MLPDALNNINKMVLPHRVKVRNLSATIEITLNRAKDEYEGEQNKADLTFKK